MKRYNIHLDEEHVKELDKMLEKIRGDKEGHWSRYSLTRADLIRFAIANTFQLKFENIHLWGTDIGDVVKKAMKKKELKKGV